MRLAIPISLCLALAGCAAPVAPETIEKIPPRKDVLFTPGAPVPGRLEYAPDRDTFAPVLTAHVAYPTQGEANNAFARATARPGLYVITLEDMGLGNRGAAGGADPRAPAGVRLFACAPGALDDQTGRIDHYRGPVVHCATDFIAIEGQRLFRATVNFAYVNHAWTMSVTRPPLTRAGWLASEPSPHDAWWWVPGRGRYE